MWFVALVIISLYFQSRLWVNIKGTKQTRLFSLKLHSIHMTLIEKITFYDIFVHQHIIFTATLLGSKPRTELNGKHKDTTWLNKKGTERLNK